MWGLLTSAVSSVFVEEDYSQMAIRVIISLILSAPLLKDMFFVRLPLQTMTCGSDTNVTLYTEIALIDTNTRLWKGRLTDLQQLPMCVLRSS